MALTTYSELKAAVADFIARADLTSQIPDFITLAEARLSRGVRAQEMQASTSISLTSGVGDLPSDYQEWVNVHFVASGSQNDQDLAFVEPDSPEWRFRYRPNGDPQMFTIMNNDIHTRPLGVGSVTFVYYQRINSTGIALSDSNTTNWLLTKCPDMYLNTALAEYSYYMKDDQRAAQFLMLAKVEGEKESIATDTSKFITNPSRPVDTGNQGSRLIPAQGTLVPTGG